MTQEHKQLLFKDLCARLPYGVYVDAYPWQRDEPSLLIECTPAYHNQELVLSRYAGRVGIMDAKVKPYLRPIESMTSDERMEWFQMRQNHCNMSGFNEIQERADFTSESLDWLNKHHFDYRGLIEKGLALEAPTGMYKK